MELFILMLIAAVGGFWYLSYVTRTKVQEAQSELQEKVERNLTNAETKVTEVKEQVRQVQEVSVSEPTKCGCGRSQTGFCVGLHKLSVEDWANHNDNPNKVIQEVKKTRKPRTKPTAKVERVSKTFKIKESVNKAETKSANKKPGRKPKIVS